MGECTATAPLFISEYVEGSSYNKAIEVFNPNSAEVNLASWSLRFANNGGSWSKEVGLSGTLAPGGTVVVANSRHKIGGGTVDYEASFLSFNGDDQIGLSNCGVVVDIVDGQHSDMKKTRAKDNTLRRKPSIQAGNAEWRPDEWSDHAKDEFSGLGSHDHDFSLLDPATPVRSGTDAIFVPQPDMDFQELSAPGSGDTDDGADAGGASGDADDADAGAGGASGDATSTAPCALFFASVFLAT